MKRITRIIAFILLFSILLTAVACDREEEDPNAPDLYEGRFAFEFEWNSRKHDADISVYLALEKDGKYTFECTQRYDFYPCYVEKGTYSLSDSEITLVPTECQTLVESEKWEMKTLSAEEQTNMTTKGTLKDQVFTATMRWNDSVWELTTDIQLSLVEKEETKALSKEHAAAAGTYTGLFTYVVNYGPENGPGMTNDMDMQAVLELDKAGTYSFACTYAEGVRNMTYCETGTYTLSGDEITLIPDEAMFMVKGGAGEMRELSEEEGESMTVKGTLKDSTAAITMRILFPYHNITSEMQLVRE